MEWKYCRVKTRTSTMVPPFAQFQSNKLFHYSSIAFIKFRQKRADKGAFHKIYFLYEYVQQVCIWMVRANRYLHIHIRHVEIKIVRVQLRIKSYVRILQSKIIEVSRFLFSLKRKRKKKKNVQIRRSYLLHSFLSCMYFILEFHNLKLSSHAMHKVIAMCL